MFPASTHLPPRFCRKSQSHAPPYDFCEQGMIHESVLVAWFVYSTPAVLVRRSCTHARRVGYCATRGRLGVGRLACPRVARLCSTDLASYHLRFDSQFTVLSLTVRVPNRVRTERAAGTRPHRRTHSTRTVKSGLGFKLGKLTRSSLTILDTTIPVAVSAVGYFSDLAPHLIDTSDILSSKSM